MPLVIKTTGLEQYAPGGEARVKVLLIGGPGAGKTRWSSYFPSPIYADCEGGLASVADRQVPYVSINNSTDMADLLNHLKLDGRLPKDKRQYQTLVIDTLDAYQRKLMNEWMEVNKKESFTGWEAWGFLAQKMQLLLTKLLNLDMNIVIAVHYKDKVTRDDDVETHQLMLQLSGDIKDTAFNDFDLVGWMGTYWEAVGGERVQKRGITFKPSPDKPFLKDRLYVTPPWLEVTFAESDYDNLFERIAEKAAGLAPSETVGQIESAEPELPGTVAVPEQRGSGPLPPAQPAELPLAQMDKPTLLKLTRDLGITTLADGSPIKGNTLKGELISAIEAHRAKAAEMPAAEPTPVKEGLATVVSDTTLEKAGTDQQLAKMMRGVPRQASPAAIESVAEGVVDTATGELLDEESGEAEVESEVESDGPPAVLEAEPTKELDEGESAKLSEGLPEPTAAEAVAAVAEKLGGEVISDTKPELKSDSAAAALARIQQQALPASGGNAYTGQKCTDCGKELGGENEQYVKLSKIKFRALLCEDDYMKRKASA